MISENALVRRKSACDGGVRSESRQSRKQTCGRGRRR